MDLTAAMFVVTGVLGIFLGTIRLIHANLQDTPFLGPAIIFGTGVGCMLFAIPLTGGFAVGEIPVAFIQVVAWMWRG